MASPSYFAEFGFGKTPMEVIMGEEAREIVDLIGNSHGGQDMIVDQTFNISVFNVLWRIVSGKRYQVEWYKYLGIPQVINTYII